MMKRIIAIIFSAALALPAFAQQNVVQAVPQTDSTVVARSPLADSSLVGKTIFQVLGQPADGSVRLNQPQEMGPAYEKYVKANGERKRQGYRIRLFFDNKQTARVESEELENCHSWDAAEFCPVLPCPSWPCKSPHVQCDSENRIYPGLAFSLDKPISLC